MKVVVLGGYGNFGTRICRALAGDARMDLVVAGRDRAKAQALARDIGAGAAALDATSPKLEDALRQLGTQLVVHTAGPFQQQDYAVARAAARAGAHYIDLADGRRFVCDFAGAMDVPFRSAGLVGICGASTVPALSSAVVDALRPRFQRLDTVDECIAPAQRAPRGVATLQGVLSYCGAPIDVWRGGRWTAGTGWAHPSKVEFARMAPRLGALCDIPDLELLPLRYAGSRSVTFRAALEVRASQRAFALLAWLRRHGWIRRPERFATFLHRASMVFDLFGTPVGGMVVRVAGVGVDGGPLRLAWHVTAGDHHGPEIPCMPAILLARRLAAGDAIEPGARACMGLLTLADFAPEFARWGMATDVVEEATRDGA